MTTHNATNQPAGDNTEGYKLMHQTTFKREIDKTKEVLPGSLSAEKLNIYWDEFSSWDDRAFEDAMTACRRELDWFPTINQIRQRRFSFANVRPRPEYDEAYKCLDCRDRGSIEVYHPIGYQPIRNQAFSIPKHLRTVVVACWCDAGKERSRTSTTEEQRRRTRCKPLIRFDAKVMKRVEKRIPVDQVEELELFVLNDWQPNFGDEWIP